MSIPDPKPRLTCVGSTLRPCADGCGRIREPGLSYCGKCRQRRKDAKKEKRT
jgi:hypothetical protein